MIRFIEDLGQSPYPAAPSFPCGCLCLGHGAIVCCARIWAHKQPGCIHFRERFGPLRSKKVDLGLWQDYVKLLPGLLGDDSIHDASSPAYKRLLAIGVLVCEVFRLKVRPPALCLRSCPHADEHDTT